MLFVRVAASAASVSAILCEFAGAAFAGGAVLAGALAGPRDEVFGGREDARVGADLGEDHCAVRACTPRILSVDQ